MSGPLYRVNHADYPGLDFTAYTPTLIIKVVPGGRVELPTKGL